MEVAVAGTGVCVGAFCVMAYTVCVTTACTVATPSLGEDWSGCKSGMASIVIGKQAMAANAIIPNKIRIDLVVIFMAHLHIVLLMDGALNLKVPC
jgi:hypothetical protein